MRRSPVRFSRPEALNRTLSLVDFITITSESRFSVHTGHADIKSVLPASRQSSLSALRIVSGNGRGRLVSQLGIPLVVSLLSEPQIALRQRLEHRAEQRISLALCAKLGGLNSVLVANSHLVGRKTHQRCANISSESISVKIQANTPIPPQPSWYLQVRDDKMIPYPAQQFMAIRAGATVVEVPGSHAIYVSNPSAVAALIEQAASGVK
jgi:pimeloyl-ACP methyl ester carboxylesterase